MIPTKKVLEDKAFYALAAMIEERLRSSTTAIASRSRSELITYEG